MNKWQVAVVGALFAIGLVIVSAGADNSYLHAILAGNCKEPSAPLACRPVSLRRLRGIFY